MLCLQIQHIFEEARTIASSLSSLLAPWTRVFGRSLRNLILDLIPWYTWVESLTEYMQSTPWTSRAAVTHPGSTHNAVPST